MIWRVRDRATFAELRRRGRRVRSGPVWISYLPDDHESSSPPRVAFAIGRRMGNAVTRNRLRRRLRAIAQDAAHTPGRIPPGAYLIGGSPTMASLTFAQLRQHVDTALEQLTEGRQ